MEVTDKDSLIRDNNRKWKESNRIEAEGLEWLYTDPSVARNQPNQLEEYLLGKSIEGARGELKKDTTAGLHAGSLLKDDNRDGNLDSVLSKFREDPLFIIKKAELHQRQVLQKYESVARSGHKIVEAAEVKKAGSKPSRHRDHSNDDDHISFRGDSRRKDHSREHHSSRNYSKHKHSRSRHRHRSHHVRKRSVASSYEEEVSHKRERHRVRERGRKDRRECRRSRRRSYTSSEDEDSISSIEEKRSRYGDRGTHRRRDKHHGRSGGSQRRGRSSSDERPSADIRERTRARHSYRRPRSDSISSEGSRASGRPKQFDKRDHASSRRRISRRRSSTSSSNSTENYGERHRRSITDSSISSRERSASHRIESDENDRGCNRSDKQSMDLKLESVRRKQGPALPGKGNTLKYAFAVTEDIMPPQAIQERAEKRSRQLAEQKQLQSDMYAPSDVDNRLEEMQSLGTEHLRSRIKQIEERQRQMEAKEEEPQKAEGDYIEAMKRHAYESAKLSERIRQRATKAVVEDE